VGYELAYSKRAAGRLNDVSPHVALEIHQNLLRLKDDPQLGKSIVAPVPCMLWGFVVREGQERITVSVTYDFSQDERFVVVETIGFMRDAREI
jgi:hypothetical protein